MPHSAKLFPLALLALVFAGCSSTLPSSRPAPASEPTLAPGTTAGPAPAPAPVRDMPPAHIVGSEEKSTMLDNFTVFVAAVDGVPVAAGRDGWGTVLPLKAGPHHLRLQFIRGVFTAEADVQLIAKPEASYQVKFSTDAQLFGKNSYCEFSIVDAATGQPATAPVRVSLLRTDAAR